jgi:hypothetical protein
MMALYDQLLAQARHLATRDQRRPQQANLRRAVSAAYYSLFHFLVERASRFLVGGSGDRDLFRKVLSRAFSHSEMASACKSFAGGSLPASVLQRMGPIPIPRELQQLAELFSNAQDVRHLADYDLAESFRRSDVLLLIDDIQQRIDDWPSIESQPATRIFLVSLLVWDRLKRR